MNVPTGNAGMTRRSALAVIGGAAIAATGVAGCTSPDEVPLVDLFPRRFPVQYKLLEGRTPKDVRTSISRARAALADWTKAHEMYELELDSRDPKAEKIVAELESHMYEDPDAFYALWKQNLRSQSENKHLDGVNPYHVIEIAKRVPQLGLTMALELFDEYDKKITGFIGDGTDEGLSFASMYLSQKLTVVDFLYGRVLTPNGKPSLESEGLGLVGTITAAQLLAVQAGRNHGEVAKELKAEPGSVRFAPFIERQWSEFQLDRLHGRARAQYDRLLEIRGAKFPENDSQRGFLLSQAEAAKSPEWSLGQIIEEGHGLTDSVTGPGSVFALDVAGLVSGLNKVPEAPSPTPTR